MFALFYLVSHKEYRGQKNLGVEERVDDELNRMVIPS